ncbi:MAG: hypothetical protein QM831_24270 [Kofleriaceae bacterium]
MLRFSLLVLAACDAGTPKPRPCVGLAELEHAADWIGLRNEARTCGDARAEQLALAMQGEFHGALMLDPKQPRIDRVALYILDDDLPGAARATTNSCLAELLTRIATPSDRRPEHTTCASTTQLLDSKTIMFVRELAEPRPLRQRAHQFGAGERISGIRSGDTLETLLADGLPIDCKDWNDETCPALVAARDRGDGRPLAKVASHVSPEDLALVAAYVNVGRPELAHAVRALPLHEPVDDFPMAFVHALADRSELFSIYEIDHSELDLRLRRFTDAITDPEHHVAILALQSMGALR